MMQAVSNNILSPGGAWECGGAERACFKEVTASKKVVDGTHEFKHIQKHFTTVQNSTFMHLKLSFVIVGKYSNPDLINLRKRVCCSAHQEACHYGKSKEVSCLGHSVLLISDSKNTFFMFNCLHDVIKMACIVTSNSLCVIKYFDLL